MKKISLLSLLACSLLFFGCKKEAIPPVAEETPEISLERQEEAAQITRAQNFLTQTLATLSTSSTIATYNSSILACPVATTDAVDPNLLHLDFGTVSDPCGANAAGTSTGSGPRLDVGGQVSLHRGNTGSLVNSCPGPYTNGSLIFDNLYVAGCYLNVNRQNSWDNLYFYAKDNCNHAPSGPGSYVDFKFMASPTWFLQFTDGRRLSTIKPIISASGPFIVAQTIVPNEENLLDYSTLAHLNYTMHIPFVENSGTNNYYTTLSIQNNTTLLEESKWGIYTTEQDQLVYSLNPVNGSKYITQGTLYAVDLKNPDSDRSVTTYDFGYDGKGNDAGGDDAFVRICYNEKTGTGNNEVILRVCKEIECLVF